MKSVIYTVKQPGYGYLIAKQNYIKLAIKAYRMPFFGYDDRKCEQISYIETVFKS